MGRSCRQASCSLWCLECPPHRTLPRRLCALAQPQGLPPGGGRRLGAVGAHGGQGAWACCVRIDGSCITALGLFRCTVCGTITLSQYHPPSTLPHSSHCPPSQGNTWQQLWDAAKAVPAAQQRLLFDPRLEGERALHFLETLPAPALFAELLAVGFSAAVQLLQAATPAASLPAVRRQLECLVAAAGPQLQHGVAAVLGGEGRDGDVAAPAPAGEQEAGGGSAAASASASPDASPDGKSRGGSSGRMPQRQPSWVRAILGSCLSCDAFRRLLLLLGSAEQVAVAAHSLLLRLDQQQAVQQQHRGQHQASDEEEQQQQAQQPAGAAHSWVPSTFAAQVADGLIAAALGEALQVAGAAAVRLPAASWAEAEVLLTQRADWDTDGSASASSSAGSSAGEEGWPDPFQREWLLSCGSREAEPGDSTAAAAAAGAAGAEPQPPLRKPSSPGSSSGGWPAAWDPGVAAGHRLYARALPSEVRIATALAPELAL